MDDRKPPRGGSSTAPRPRLDEVRDLARALFTVMVTAPGLAGKEAGHLAYEAIQKAKAFQDAADEHLK